MLLFLLLIVMILSIIVTIKWVKYCRNHPNSWFSKHEGLSMIALLFSMEVLFGVPAIFIILNMTEAYLVKKILRKSMASSILSELCHGVRLKNKFLPRQNSVNSKKRLILQCAILSPKRQMQSLPC